MSMFVIDVKVKCVIMHSHVLSTSKGELLVVTLLCIL